MNNSSYRPKILFVINTFDRAGAEKALVALLGLMDREKYDISLFSLINRGRMFDEIPKGVHCVNKNPRKKSVLNFSGHMYLFFVVLKSFFKGGKFLTKTKRSLWILFRQIKNRKIHIEKIFWRTISYAAPVVKDEYDLVVAYLEGAATSYVARHVKAKKKVAFVHVDYTRAGYFRQIDYGAYIRYDRVFCVSDGVRESFLKEYPEFEDKVSVFHNMVPVEAIRESAEKKGGFEDEYNGTRILTIGRLHYQKTYDIAIAAMKKLTDSGNADIRWYAMGDGMLRKKLMKLIKKNGLTGKFILLGNKANPYPYIKQCDICVQATRYEGWSIAVAEELILKKPAIVSDCAGNREHIIHNETGMVISLSADNLAAAIVKMVNDTEYRNRIIKNLDAVNYDFADEINRLYELAES